MDNVVTVVGLDDTQIVNMNTSIDDINGEVVNLIFVAIDGSGSMDGYVKDMTKCLDEFKTAITNSKEVDDILLARADFNSRVCVGGYKKVKDFDINYNASGNTILYDTIIEGKDKMVQYRDYLKQQGVRTKCVFAVFSDGCDTASKNMASAATGAVKILNDQEITTAFICFGSDALPEAQRLGFKNILNVNSNVSDLRKAFDCLSKSVISASKSVVPVQNNFFTV